VDGQISILYDLRLGNVQGSILGPVLYAIFVSPLAVLVFLLIFVDDIPSFIIWVEDLITDIESSLESITKQLMDSGLLVNIRKLCLFSKGHVRWTIVILNG
jgi:hypothetical protein